MGHEGKCANVHGHNYTIFVTAKTKSLDNVGRVIDFSVLKQKVGDWIDANWDHTFLIFKEDDILMPLKEQFSIKKAPYICDFNPTAENMADHLLSDICPKLFADEDVVVSAIELWESENNKVRVTL